MSDGVLDRARRLIAEQHNTAVTPLVYAEQLSFADALIAATERAEKAECALAGTVWPDGFEPTERVDIELAVELAYMKLRAERAEADLALAMKVVDAARVGGRDWIRKPLLDALDAFDAARKP